MTDPRLVRCPRCKARNDTSRRLRCWFCFLGLQKLDAAREENNRLRDALEEIASGSTREVMGLYESSPRASRRYMMKRARAALDADRG